MNPMTVDTSEATRIAHRSTKAWGRARWSELTVWHFPDGTLGGKRWMSEVKGCSTVEGEREKVQRLASDSLERALKLIDESDVGIAVREEALEYAEDHDIPLRKFQRQSVPKDTDGRLSWLFGNATVGEVRQLCGDESIMIMPDDTLMLPAGLILPFVDRHAFQAYILPKGRTDGAC